MKRWRKAHPEKQKPQVKDREKCNEYSRGYFQRAKTELRDTYVAKILIARTPLKAEDIPQDVIHLKRGVMLLKKLLVEKGYLESMRGVPKLEKGKEEL